MTEPDFELDAPATVRLHLQIPTLIGCVYDCSVAIRPYRIELLRFGEQSAEPFHKNCHFGQRTLEKERWTEDSALSCFRPPIAATGVSLLQR